MRFAVLALLGLVSVQADSTTSVSEAISFETGFFEKTGLELPQTAMSIAQNIIKSCDAKGSGGVKDSKLT